MLLQPTGQGRRDRAGGPPCQGKEFAMRTDVDCPAPAPAPPPMVQHGIHGHPPIQGQGEVKWNDWVVHLSVSRGGLVLSCSVLLPHRVGRVVGAKLTRLHRPRWPLWRERVQEALRGPHPEPTGEPRKLPPKIRDSLPGEVL
eukprot:12877123-Alexandrium_andersonii.AAC.1